MFYCPSRVEFVLFAIAINATTAANRSGLNFCCVSAILTDIVITADD
jgi:hypothetical protein